MSFPTVVTAMAGGPQTGFTSPTFTSVLDKSTDLRSNQAVVTSIGGTQGSAIAHTVNAPFTITARKPSLMKTLATALLNGVTGQYSKVPYNEYLILTRKGAQVALGQWVVNEYRTAFKVYAGTETYDAANIRSGLSCHVGLLNGYSATIGDSLITGVI